MASSSQKYYVSVPLGLIIRGWDLAQHMTTGRAPCPKGYATLNEAEAAYTQATGRRPPAVTTKLPGQSTARLEGGDGTPGGPTEGRPLPEADSVPDRPPAPFRATVKGPGGYHVEMALTLSQVRSLLHPPAGP